MMGSSASRGDMATASCSSTWQMDQWQIIYAVPKPHLRCSKLKWARKSAKAVAYIHAKRVLHCNISVGNLLLDKDLNIKLCDFQGRILHPDGGSAERVRSSMPRPDPNKANPKTDIFVLGTAIYFIVTGHPPFPELDSWQDNDEVYRWFKRGQFPSLQEAQGGRVVEKCWTGQYEAAENIVLDLENLCTIPTS